MIKKKFVICRHLVLGRLASWKITLFYGCLITVGVETEKRPANILNLLKMFFVRTLVKIVTFAVGFFD